VSRLLGFRGAAVWRVCRTSTASKLFRVQGCSCGACVPH
jgi:hypothetical protein